jgi:hypothetical protein
LHPASITTTTPPLPPFPAKTEFERLGINDQPLHEGSDHSAFPANTNILYVGLGAVRAAVEAAIAAGGGDVLPGLIFNLKKKVGGCVGCVPADFCRASDSEIY